jgi:hypothetical protein
LNVSALNIGGPLFFALSRSFGASLAGSSTGQRFPVVCVKAAKWFRRGGEMFRRGVAGKRS